MEKLRYWLVPILVAISWVVASAYVLYRLGSVSDQPLAEATLPEVEIEVTPPAQAVARSSDEE